MLLNIFFENHYTQSDTSLHEDVNKTKLNSTIYEWRKIKRIIHDKILNKVIICRTRKKETANQEIHNSM